MKEITFTIPGKPFAKQRPRFSRKSGTAFTPKETVGFENAVRSIAATMFKEPIQGPVGVCILAKFEPPPSWSKRKRAEHLKLVWHTQKPDQDNIAKAICDGLNRIAFADDSQIASHACQKIWSDRAETIVTVTILDAKEAGNA